MNVTLFENWVFVDGWSSYDEVIRVGSNIIRLCLYKKGKFEPDMHLEGRQYEDTGRMLSISQGMPEAKLGEMHGKGFLSQS